MSEKEQLLQEIRRIISDALRRINLEGKDAGLGGVKAHLEKASDEVKELLTALYESEEG